MSSDYLLRNDHLWCSSVAKAVDSIICYEQEANIFLQPALFLVSRLISCIVFPILASIDYASLKCLSLKERVIGLRCRKGEERVQAHRLKAKRSNNAARRCFAGVVASPTGLVCPDAQTHHFIPSYKRPGEAWNSGKHYHTPGNIRFPRVSAEGQTLEERFEEVANIVRNAGRNDQKVAVIGAGMSQGKQNLPLENEILIDLKDINHVEIDRDSKVVRVGAGATWQDIQRVANPLGLAVRVMQASNIFTVGGSLSANCHGWDIDDGALINTVQAITIVDGYGQVKRLTPDDEEFGYLIGGYGGFGVIVEAEIELTENLLLTSAGTEILPEDYYQYFRSNVQGDETVDMHLYRLSLDPDNLFETGIAVNYHRWDGDDGRTDPIIDEHARGKAVERVELHAVRRMPKKVAKLAWMLEKNGALTPGKMTRNQIMRPSINPIFNNSLYDAEWLQEYFVPGEHLADFIDFLRGVLTENEVKVFNASVRFVKQDTISKMGYANAGDRFPLVLFFNQKLDRAAVEKTQGWVQQVNSWLAEHDGAFYLPYQPFDSEGQLEACYPQMEGVIEKKRELDPNNIFYNGFWEKIAPPAA